VINTSGARRLESVPSEDVNVTIKTIAVLGAGHGGTAAAADLTRRGFSVRLHARNPDRLKPFREQGGIEARGVQQGLVPVGLMTTDVREAVDGADLVMLVVPSVAHEPYAQALAPLLRPGQPIFINPGHTGGGLHFLHALRKAGYRGDVRLCETVTLTYITRMEGPGTVGIYSYTKNLGFAALPARHGEELFALMKPVYPNIRLVSSVLETALANLNAVFHPPGMVMNAGWIEHTNGGFLFYREGVTPAVGKVTQAVDDERMAVAKALGVPHERFIDTFFRAGLTSAEAHAAGDISRACYESEPNKTIKSPPSLRHRYVMEDIGFGLVPFAALGRLADVPTPTIDALIQIGGAALGIDFASSGLTLEKLGLKDMSAAEVTRFVREG
jgi:opine dehydrogenase